MFFLQSRWWEAIVAIYLFFHTVKYTGGNIKLSVIIHYLIFLNACLFVCSHVRISVIFRNVLYHVFMLNISGCKLKTQRETIGSKKGNKDNTVVGSWLKYSRGMSNKAEGGLSNNVGFEPKRVYLKKSKLLVLMKGFRYLVFWRGDYWRTIYL